MSYVTLAEAGAKSPESSDSSVNRKPEVPADAVRCVMLWNFTTDDKVSPTRLLKGEEVLMIREEYAHGETGLRERWKRALVQKKNGQKCFVTRSYIERVQKVLEHQKIYRNTWFVGEMSVEEAQELVRRSSLPIGAFVICAPPTYKRTYGHKNYALVIKIYKHTPKAGHSTRSVLSYRIDRDIFGRYFINNSQKFANLYTLVKCCTHPVPFLSTKLVCAPKLKQNLIELEVPAPPKRITVDAKYLQETQIAQGASIRRKHGRAIEKLGPWFVGKMRVDDARLKLHDKGAKAGKFVIFAPATDPTTATEEQLSVLLKTKDTNGKPQDKLFKVKRDKQGNYFVNEKDKHKSLKHLAERLQEKEMQLVDKPAVYLATTDDKKVVTEVASRAKQMVEAQHDEVEQDVLVSATEAAVKELQSLPIEPEISTGFEQIVSDAPAEESVLEMPVMTEQKEAELINRIAAKVAELIMAQKIIGAQAAALQKPETPEKERIEESKKTETKPPQATQIVEKDEVKPVSAKPSKTKSQKESPEQTNKEEKKPVQSKEEVHQEEEAAVSAKPSETGGQKDHETQKVPDRPTSAIEAAIIRQVVQAESKIPEEKKVQVAPVSPKSSKSQSQRSEKSKTELVPFKMPPQPAQTAKSPKSPAPTTPKSPAVSEAPKAPKKTIQTIKPSPPPKEEPKIDRNVEYSFNVPKQAQAKNRSEYAQPPLVVPKSPAKALDKSPTKQREALLKFATGGKKNSSEYCD